MHNVLGIGARLGLGANSLGARFTSSHALATPRAANRSCTPPWHSTALATPPAPPLLVI